MKLQRTESRRGRIAAVVVGVAVAVAIRILCVFTPFDAIKSTLFSIAIGALACFSLLFRVEIRSWWGMALANAFVAEIGILAMHAPLYHWRQVTVTTIPLRNGAMSLIPLLLFTALTADVKILGTVYLLFCLAFGIIDCAVVQFTGNLIRHSDIFAMGAAMNVLAQYRLEIYATMVIAAIITAIGLVTLLRAKQVRPSLKKLPVRLAALALAVVCFGYSWWFLSSRSVQYYRGRSLRFNGIIGELILEYQDSVIRPPKDFSEQEVEALCAEYTAPAAETESPHVIAVMVESLSDLSVLGDLKLDVDCTPFIHSLADESIHGWAMASTVSNGTARTEWEFLTGNSMAFTPEGSMPYGQYVSEGENSVVKLFKRAGYHTVAMHPYYSNGWNRDSIYPMLGFDDIYFLEDLEWDECVRKYVSDSAFVHQLIRVFEERPKDRPLFFFGITMQNHGSYVDLEYQSTVRVLEPAGDYPSLEQYLSLTRLSDDAIREMIDYFRACDEKVQIVFFGDHQPSLPDNFLDDMGLEADEPVRHIVPFVIWNNYDRKVEEVEMTSINFLMPRVLQEIGYTGAPYFNFLNALREKVPSVSATGYLADGKYHALNDDPDGLLREYRYFQYANMFCRDMDDSLFVGGGAD